MSTFRSLLAKKAINSRKETFFCIEAVHDSTIRLRTYRGSSPVLYYGLNNETIDEYREWIKDTNEPDYYETIELKAGNKCYFYGNNTYFSGNGKKDTDTTGSSIYSTFVITGLVDLKGKLSTLLSLNNIINLQRNYCFFRLFYNCKSLRYINNLELANPYLSRYCYSQAFYNSSIKNAPIIYTNRCTVSCFEGCFQNCTELKNTLFNNITICSQSSFYGCYRNCTSLEKANDIYIKTDNGNSGSLSYTFYECSGLINGPSFRYNSRQWQNGFYDMFFNCKILKNSKGYIHVNNSTSTSKSNKSHFYQMFYGCNAIEEVPILIYSKPLVEQTTNNVFNRTFYNCKSLKEIKVYAPYIDDSQYLYQWLYGVPEGGTIWLSRSMIDAYEAGLIPTGASGIPASWTVKELTPDMLPVKVDF